MPTANPIVKDYTPNFVIQDKKLLPAVTTKVGKELTVPKTDVNLQSLVEQKIAENKVAETAAQEEAAKAAEEAKKTADIENARILAERKISEDKVKAEIDKRAADRKAAEDEVLRIQAEDVAKKEAAEAARKEGLKTTGKIILAQAPGYVNNIGQTAGVITPGTTPDRILSDLSNIGNLYTAGKLAKSALKYKSSESKGTKAKAIAAGLGALIPAAVLTTKVHGNKPAVPTLPTTTGPVEQAQFVSSINDAVAQDTATATGNYNSKINSVVANNGGVQGVVDKVNAGDPILTAQLESIQQEYEIAQQEIKANYAAAMAQIQGYQTQASGVLSDVAKAQQQDFATASGGLQAMQPGTGMTPTEASAAGLSSTAIGGGGITGAALARGLGASSASQLAAQQVNLGTTLNDQLASGALDQADYLNSLALSKLQSKNTAKENKLARDLAAQKDALNFQQDLAKMKYSASLSNSGGSSSSTAFKDSSPVARGMQIAYPKNASTDSTQLIDAINAEIATNPKVTDKNPAVAAAAWTKFYGDLSTGFAKATKGKPVPPGSSPFDTLASLGIPTTAQGMVTKLGISK